MIEGGEFELVSLNLSVRKGTRKDPVPSLVLVEGLGAEGDAHAGPGPRQLSLLGAEDIEAAAAALAAAAAPGSKPPALVLGPGSFAENITTRGVDLASLPVGTRLEIGEAALEISQIGKDCHRGCEIRSLSGDCVMPRRGVFAIVLKGGRIGLEDRCRYRL